jgi:hypothetical protein
MTAAFFSSLVSSCSRQGEEIVDHSDYYARTESKSSISKVAECSDTNCVPIVMNSRVKGLQAGIFRGFVGQALNWQIQGFDPATEKEKDKKLRRKVVVLLNRIPENSKISPSPGSKKLSSLTTVDWIPKMPQEGWLEVILRDYDRCLALEKDPNSCEAYDLLSDYDTRQQAIPWLITSSGGQITEQIPPK